MFALIKGIASVCSGRNILSRIKICFYACIFIVTVMFLCFLNEGRNSDILRKPKSHNKTGLCNRTDEHLQRKIFLQQMCNESSHVRSINFIKRPDAQQIFANDKYNFAVCVVPKSGCTFMKQLILYLSDPRAWETSDTLLEMGLSAEERIEFGERQKEMLFNMARYKIHHWLDYDPIKIQIDEFKYLNRTKVILVRNPFSRLFSAYIDKIYIPSTWFDVKNWYRLKMYGKDVQEINDCNAKFVTFEDFLEFVIFSAEIKSTDIHWEPVMSLCKPCETNPDIIIRQESYYSDVQYLIETLQITEEEREMLDGAIGKHGVQSSETVSGLIQTMYLKGLKYSYSCITRLEMTRRIWEALQLQGHIYSYQSFPYDQIIKNHKFRANEYTSDVASDDINFVVKVFLSHMRQMPIRADESKAQRERALISAYRNVKQEIIIQIQALFYHDFKIFGYDFQPPRAGPDKLRRLRV